MQLGSTRTCARHALHSLRRLQGQQLLRRWMQAPAWDLEEIERRQHAIAIFIDDPETREQLKGLLKDVRVPGHTLQVPAGACHALSACPCRQLPAITSRQAVAEHLYQNVDPGICFFRSMICQFRSSNKPAVSRVPESNKHGGYVS